MIRTLYLLSSLLGGCTIFDCAAPSEMAAYEVARNCIYNRHCIPLNVDRSVNNSPLTSIEEQIRCAQVVTIREIVETQTGTNYYYTCVDGEVYGEFRIFFPRASERDQLSGDCYIANYAFYETEDDLKQGLLPPIDHLR